jgi:hypothetical protein
MPLSRLSTAMPACSGAYWNRGRIKPNALAQIPETASPRRGAGSALLRRRRPASEARRSREPQNARPTPDSAQVEAPGPYGLPRISPRSCADNTLDPRVNGNASSPLKDAISLPPRPLCWGLRPTSRHLHAPGATLGAPSPVVTLKPKARRATLLRPAVERRELWRALVGAGAPERVGPQGWSRASVAPA